MNQSLDDFRKWQEQERAIEIALDTPTLLRVKENIEGLLHVNLCFLKDAYNHNVAGVPRLDGVVSGYEEILRELDRLIHKEAP